MSVSVRVPPNGELGCAWRIVRKPYADLSGKGAELKGGRWNSPGRPLVYLSGDAALPVLEILVHLDLSPDLIPEDYVLMKVDLSSLSSMPVSDWLEDGPGEPIDIHDSRAYGDQWLVEARSPLLRVPSVVVPESCNLLLNPMHPLAASISFGHRPFSFDRRLFEFNG